MKTIQLDNITFNFKQRSFEWEIGADGLGGSLVGIPYKMVKKFYKDEGFDKTIPHLGREETSAVLKSREEFMCYNTDTQIVLMKWLNSRTKKVTLDYHGDDPFWIYHDYCHSNNDVYGSEVSNITSYTEWQRILEGGELALSRGHGPKASTIYNLMEEWEARFSFRERPNSMTTLSIGDARHIMETEQFELLEASLERGYLINNIHYD